jgi:hypothetical protein
MKFGDVMRIFSGDFNAGENQPLGKYHFGNLLFNLQLDWTADISFVVRSVLNPGWDGFQYPDGMVCLAMEDRRYSMTKEKFLTIRWNNILTLGLGIPALVYIVYAFSTLLWTTRGGLIGLSIIGVLY